MLAEAGQGVLWVLLVPGRHGCWGRHRELSFPAVDLEGPQVIRAPCRRTCTSSNRRGPRGGVILPYFFPSLPSLPGVCLPSPFHLPPFWPLRKQSLIIRRTTVQDLRGWLISPLPNPNPNPDPAESEWISEGQAHSRAVCCFANCDVFITELSRKPFPMAFTFPEMKLCGLQRRETGFRVERPHDKEFY